MIKSVKVSEWQSGREEPKDVGRPRSRWDEGRGTKKIEEWQSVREIKL
jgi:hypothetical protein